MPANERLRGWIRDYGHEKQPVFIADLTAVLDVNADLLAACNAARAFLDHIDNNRLATELDVVLSAAIAKAEQCDS